ncbi:uncharacterized protein LOC133198421 [Saccostrea echinata]|uniref:uncharacterized protein LOC133198421 n=1 Tax=Saccostrea echinata TaxID=191078 RepID=UPI002A809E63|nr:uncharacterized protein LOC133198421 [Saccostrea echinata]
MEELSALNGKSSFENKMKDITAFEEDFERTVPEALDEGVKIKEASEEVENEALASKESVIETTAKEKSESEAEAKKNSEMEAEVNKVSESEAATKEKFESEAEANKGSVKAAGNEGSKCEAATYDDSECKAEEHRANDSEATGRLMKNTEQLNDDKMNFEISDVLVKLENLEQCGENKDFEDPCHHPNPHPSPGEDNYPQLQEDRINMRCEGITQSFLKESLPRKVQSQAKQEEFIERENVPSLQPTKAENSPTEKGKTVSDESLGTERQEEYDQRNFSTEHSNKNDFSLSNGKSNTEIPNVVNIRNSSMEKKDKTEEADNENSSTKQPDISHSRSIPTKLTNISDNLDQDSSGISTLETSNEGQKGYVSDKMLPPEENIIQGADKSSGINMQCLSDDVVEDDVSQGQGETGSSAEELAQRKLHSERKYKGHSMKENLPLLNPSNYDVGNSPPDQFASAVTESSHREETSNEDLDGEVTEDGGDDEEEDGIPSEENKKRHPSNEKEEKVDIEDDGGDNFVGVEEETMSGDYHQLEEMINRAEDNPSVDDIYNRKVMKNKDQSHSKDDVPEENRRQALDNLYGSNIPHQSHELVEDVSDDDEVDDDEGEEDDVPSQENGGKELDNLYERRNPHQSHELVEEVVSEDGNMDIYKCDNTDEKGDDEVINDDDFPSEETIVRAEDNPKIYIKKVLKSTDNSNSNQPTKKLDRVYNQKHCCFICQKMVLHLPDHLWRCHKSHPVVKEALSSNRKGRFDQIRAKGDHLHNIKVVKEGKGELILSRRRGSFNSQEFGPCPECLEWMHLKSIDIHYRKFHKHCKMFRKLKSGSTLVDKKQHTVPVSTPSAQVLQNKSVTSIEESSLTKLHSENEYEEITKKENSSSINPSQSNVGNSPRVELTSAVTESSHGGETDRNDVYNSSKGMQDVAINKNFQTKHTFVAEKELSEKQLNESDFLEPPTATVELNLSMTQQSSEDLGEDDCDDVSDDDDIDDEGEEDDVHSQENGGKELDNLYERSNPHQSHELVGEVITENNNIDVSECDDADERGEEEEEVMGDDDFPSEETIVRAEDNPKIYIKKILKSTDSSNSNQPTKKLDRVYNQKHCCFICRKMVLHLPDHLWRCHKSHLAVKEALSSNQKGRFDQIRAKGDHLHNIKVVKEGKGELILSRRRESFNSQEFGPCPECLEWMHLKSIDKHNRKFHKHCKKFRKLKSSFVDKKQHTVPVSTPSVLQNKSVTSLEESAVTKLHSKNKFQKLSKKENSSSINPSQSDVGNSLPDELTSAETESSHGEETYRNDVGNSSRRIPDVAINQNFQTEHKAVSEKESSEKHLNERNFAELPTATVELNLSYLSMTQPSSEDLGEDVSDDVSDDDDSDEEEDEDDVLSQGRKELDNLFGSSIPIQSHELVGEVITENDNMNVSECDDADERGEEEVMSDDDFLSEETIVRAEDNPKIYIKKVLKSTDNSNSNQPTKKLDRVFNQKHCCFICQKMVLHLPDHLWRCHKSHPVVKEALSSNRKGRFDQIRTKGDHLHNIKVVKEGKGELILSRRPERFISKDYEPCYNCLEWMHKGTLKKHFKAVHREPKEIDSGYPGMLNVSHNTPVCTEPTQLQHDSDSVSEQVELIYSYNKKRQEPARKLDHQQWSSEEKKELELYFCDFLVKKTCPSRIQCLDIIERSKVMGGVLHMRSWQNITKKISQENKGNGKTIETGNFPLKRKASKSKSRTKSMKISWKKAMNKSIQKSHKVLARKKSSKKGFSHKSRTLSGKSNCDLSITFKRKRWTKEEERELDFYFGRYFASKTCPSKRECMKVIAKSAECGGVIHTRYWQNIIKKISSENKKNRKSVDMSTPNLHTEESELSRTETSIDECDEKVAETVGAGQKVGTSNADLPLKSTSKHEKGDSDSFSNIVERKLWSKEEVNELLLYLGEFLTTKTCPSKKRCLEAIEKSKQNGGVLQNRYWHNIIKKISTENNKKRKSVSKHIGDSDKTERTTSVFSKASNESLGKSSTSGLNQKPGRKSTSGKSDANDNICERKRWSSEEEQEIKKYFSEFLSSGTCPSKKQCLKAIEKSKQSGGTLHTRYWHNIVKKISNTNRKASKLENTN